MTAPEPTSDPAAPAAPFSRLDELRAEAEAQDDKTRKAVIADAVGRVLLADPAQEAVAVRELLAAYNHDPAFRPPLFALVDGFERKRSFKNLGRLYDAEAKSAPDAAGKTDALLDRAMFLLGTGGALEEVDALLDQAVEPRPDRASAWAVIEVLARHRGRAALAGEAGRARARAARDARLRAALLHEAAAETTDDAEALSLLVDASEADPASERIATALDGAARAAGAFGVVLDALERRAAQEESAALASALYCEASALARARLDDAARAAALSARAVERTPEDPLAWLERAEAAEAAEQWAVVETACARVLELLGPELGPFAAALHHRRADAAQRDGRAEDAAAHLLAARDAAPASRALDALAASGSEDLLQVRSAELEARAAGDGLVEDRLVALRELAGIAAALNRRADLEARVVAFAELASRPPADGGPTEPPDGSVWRDLAFLALSVSGRAGLGAGGVLDALAPHLLDGLAPPADGEDAGGVERSVWRMTALHLATPEARPVIARAALADPACAAWAPEIAAIVGARANDLALVAEAHEVLARLAGDAQDVSAHHVARARALARAGDLGGAQAALTQALAASPADAFARAFLEDVGRASGDVDAVLRTLRESSADTSPELIAARISSAGHVAEAEGNTALARRSAEEALAARPEAVDARLLLARVALRAGDEALLDQTLGGLGGAPWSLLVALRAAPEAREAALVALLPSPQLGMEAALALAITPGVSSDAARQARESLGQAVTLPADPLDGVRSGRSGAWLSLSDSLAEIGAGDAAEALSAHGLRVALLRGEMDDDSFLRVAELEEIDGPVRPDPSLVSGEVILDAVLRGESSDFAELVAAQGRYVGRGAPPDVVAAHARMRVAAGRGDEVVEELTALVTADPTDVASLDSLRVAAREAHAWREVVLACDLLSERVSGELRAQLLEEAAAVLMDEIDDVEGAEERCRRALAVDRQRDIAYARLHDLLAERGDDAALLDLVTARSDVFDDPDILAPLLYEQARLFRGLGQVDEALASLDNLLLLESEHIGGLALQVEIYVQRESFEDAVDSLRALAGAQSAPASQRRIARLGAAEFLEKKLQDLAGALAELSAIETELRMADRVVYERMASLAERLGRLEDAARAYGEAASRATDPLRRAAAYRKLGELARRQGRLEDAAAAYRSALDAQPDDVDSAEALAEIPVAGDAEERVQAVSVALRAGGFPVSVEHLTRIERVARLAGDWGLSSATQELLRALEGAPTGAVPLELPRLRPVDEGKLSLLAGLSRDAVFELATLTCDALSEVEPLEPSTFGASAKDQKQRGSEPSADLVHAIASQLGAAGDVFVAGDGKTFVGGASKGRPFFVLGRGARVPLALAYDTAYFATGIRAELAPLTVRCARAGATGAATAIFALAAAAGSAVPGAETRDGFADLARSFAKAAPKRSKRIAELVDVIGEGRAVVSWAREFQARLVRVAVLASGDLGRGLAALTGSNARPESVAASEAASALAREWLRSDVISARASFGWRPPD